MPMGESLTIIPTAPSFHLAIVKLLIGRSNVCKKCSPIIMDDSCMKYMQSAITDIITVLDLDCSLGKERAHPQHPKRFIKVFSDTAIGFH